MPRKVRLGFVGAGRMGQQAHIANYLDLPDVELVCLAEGRSRLAEAVAQRHGIAETCGSHRDLLARGDLDAVVAIMWFGLHYGLVRDLLAAGLHVATEKSLAVTQPAAEALVAAAAAAQRVYQVSYMKRFDPGVQLARRRIAAWQASGEVGALTYARIWCCSPGDWMWHIEPCLGSDEPVPPYDTPGEPPQPGASEDDTRWVWGFLNFYSHQTNLLRYLLGEDYGVAHHESWSGGDVISAVSPSGTRCTLEFAHFGVSGWDEGFELRFEKAQIRGRVPAPLARQAATRLEIERMDESSGVSLPPVPPVWAMRAQAEAFVAAVRAQGPEISPASEAAKEIDLAWKLAETRLR